MKRHYFNISVILLTLSLFIVSCKKEYITNEYITNEYITNEYITNNDYVYNQEYYSIILKGQEAITISIMPPYLQAGDSVAICATSNALSEQDRQNVQKSIDILESWGLEVLEADNLYNTDGRYAGTVSQRRDALKKLIRNPNIKAIIAARGGYGCVQLLPIDVTPLIDNPKWIVGFSDVTVLHAAVNNAGIQTIHGAMANNFNNNTSVANLKEALFGTYSKLSIPTNPNCIQGSAEGRLVGGNLTTFYALGGTIEDLNVKDAILFFEDTGEANYNVDRMLSNLKLSGKLNEVKGIIVGQLTSMTQGADRPINEIILNNVRDLEIPVMYGISAGHDSPNLPLYFGRKIKLDVGAATSTISF